MALTTGSLAGVPDPAHNADVIDTPDGASLAGVSGGGHTEPSTSTAAVTAVPHPMLPGGMMTSGNTPV
jgi:hypothetical protein